MDNSFNNIRNTPIGQLVSYPIQRVHVELTNSCNFDCVFCPKSVMKRPLGFMDKELAYKIIDEISYHNISDKITFHIMGEPLLHPKLFDILGYCKKKSMDAGITTNGSFLNDKNIDRLIKANIKQINISLQTPSDKSFSLRKSNLLQFTEYSEQIVKYIKKLRDNKCSTIVKIHFLNTRFKNSMREESGDIDIIGSTETLQSVFTEWTEKIYSIESIKNDDQKLKVLNGLKKVTINKWNVLEIAQNIFFETYVLNSWGNAFTDENISNAKFGYCSTMKDHFGILFNGDIILCCKDYDGKTKFGNLYNNSIVELLNSKPVLEVVKGFQKYIIKNSYCKRCLGGKNQYLAMLNQVGSIFFMNLMKWYFYNSKVLYR